jgi:predicted nuclease with TOPRIM domain
MTLQASKQRIRSLESELRAIAGKLGNRAPDQAPDLQMRNQALATKLESLETTLFQLLTDQLNPRHTDEALRQAEVLRLAAVEYCQQSQTDPELWKNIAF